MTIVNRDKLFSDLNDNLRSLDGDPHIKLGLITVCFWEDDEIVKETSLPEAIDFLVNDLWWDAEGDWSKADKITFKLL